MGVFVGAGGVVVGRSVELVDMGQADSVEGGGVGGLCSTVEDVGADGGEVRVGLLGPFRCRALDGGGEAVGAVDLLGSEHDERTCQE